VCEIDAEGVAWPILQDANYNAVALADDTGAVVAQRVLSPYGRVLISDPPAGAATPPLSRVGHQGLFAERTLAWHNRNRTLLSDLGRFAQRDPNATGQGASDALAMHGGAAPMDKLRTDPAMLFANGLNIYGYAGASPSQHRDPSGLFIDLFMPGPSDFVTGALEGMVSDYAVRLEWDIDWATDWDLPDDLHSRGDSTWVQFSMLRGVYDAFEFGIPGTGLGINPLRYFASDASSGGDTHRHHIMTNKNYIAGLRWSVRYELLFKKYDIPGNPFRWKENIVPLPNHAGPHPEEYHREIFRRVRKALANAPRDPQAREQALREALKKMNDRLKKTGGRAYHLKRPGRR